MKAFLMAIAVMLVVALGTGIMLNGVMSESASEAYSTPSSTRL